MSAYNYDSFSPNDYDLQSADGPNVGEQTPDFELRTADGQLRRLLDFDGVYLVLELGSITCPLFMSRQDNMQKIAKDYPQASHAVLYVREAHPGASVPAHKTMADKQACAGVLSTELADPRDIYIDGLKGQVHQAYGSMPNAVYVIDKAGVVRFKAPWNNPTATRKALSALFAGEKVNLKSYFKPATPAVVVATARRAGKGSARDFLIGLPKLIWNVLIKNNLRTFMAPSDPN